jgi:hypothetical protein
VVVANVLGCIKQLKKFAKWDAAAAIEGKDKPVVPTTPVLDQSRLGLPSSGQLSVGLNLGYTINLNLPATSDPAVFNAIFRALKEHLLKATND